MRIVKAIGEYFQSYQYIEFDYQELGLVLISGQTKAGKSTSLDLPCWVLTGTTSKDSAADDVRSWFAEGLTRGTLEVHLPDGAIIITRIRGSRSNQNDLYYQVGAGGEPIRGKDAADTQKKIHELLGMDSELYINGSYLHQFSKADQFFISKAKDRRETLERIANLDLPIKLAEKTSEARKDAKKERDAAESAKVKAEGRLESANEELSGRDADIDQWNSSHKNSIQKLTEELNDWVIRQDSRVKSETASAGEWETKRKQREVQATEIIDRWYSERDQRVAKAKEKAEEFENGRFERALKIADQLTEIEKLSVPEEQIEQQFSQIRHQLSAMDSVEDNLNINRKKIAECEASIKSIRAEYQRLTSVSGTCPTCLGPADNDHRHGRMEEIETEIVSLSEQKVELEPVITDLTKALDARPKLQEAYYKLTKKQAENKSLQSKAEDLKAQVTVLRAEKNPHTASVDYAIAESNPYLNTVKTIQEETNPHFSKIESIKAETNPYGPMLERARAEVNPFTDLKEKSIKKAEECGKELQRLIKELNQCEKKVSSLTWLYDKSFELRGRLLEQSVRQLESKTNQYLERFFDAEIRVKFTLDEDKLEVGITNEGYECPYRQLSGGERCLLKLAFSLNYMKAAEDKAGIKFNVLMLDEALNGLDASLKVKAFTLLQHLESEYESILVIDHSEELKTLFSRRFIVIKNGAFSKIELVEEH